MYSLSKRIFIKISPLVYKCARILHRDMYVYLYGKKVYYDLKTDIGDKLLRMGKFETAELNAIEKYIKKDSVCIDIGANIGTHSLFMASIATEGKIFAFEPSHATYSFLLKNTTSSNVIYPINMAVSNKAGVATFYTATDNAYSGLVDTGKRPIIGTEQVITTQLDDIVSALGISKIDFIKIDVEGNEKDTINGSLKTISRHKPVMLIEISGETGDVSSPEKTIQKILDIGYNAFTIRNKNIVPFTVHDSSFYNYLFVPKK